MQEHHCPHCQGRELRRMGFTPQGKQRMICQSSGCGKSFLLDYHNQDNRPDMPERIRAMLASGTGVRTTARSLNVSTRTVTHIKQQAREESA